jgi:hypothetical protein
MNKILAPYNILNYATYKILIPFNECKCMIFDTFSQGARVFIWIQTNWIHMLNVFLTQNNWITLIAQKIKEHVQCNLSPK